jgi:hypothetical protein
VHTIYSIEPRIESLYVDQKCIRVLETSSKTHTAHKRAAIYNPLCKDNIIVSLED